MDVPWDSRSGEIDAGSPGGSNFNAGIDAVINLAGAPIAEGRWTEERKKLLRVSRVDTTRGIVAAIFRMDSRPRVLISASAIGYYGDRGDEVLEEETPAGKGFLADLAREWEAEALKAEPLGVRVALTRFGIILAKQGGALPAMMAPFKLGAGGKLGSGRQWMSWVALDDVVAIIHRALEDDGVRGPLNVVAPNPVRNVEFTKELAAAMHRPAIFAAPAFALRLALGEMADGALLASQRVAPAALQRLGYKFLHPELGETLQSILG
jgi:uncharacterized protein (TIGR01777 family)